MTEIDPIPITGGILGGLGSAVGLGLEYGSVRDTATCTVRSMRDSLAQGLGRYAFYPTLALTTRVLSGATNVMQVVRHEVVVRTVKGNYYYVGGRSRYWAGGRAFHAYQWSVDFVMSTGSGSESERLWETVRETESEVVVIQVKGARISKRWVNPEPPRDCNEAVVGWLLDWLERTGRGAVLTNYVPAIRAQPSGSQEIPGRLVISSGGHYSAEPLGEYLRGTSTTPPTPTPLS